MFKSAEPEARSCRRQMSICTEHIISELIWSQYNTNQHTRNIKLFLITYPRCQAIHVHCRVFALNQENPYPKRILISLFFFSHHSTLVTKNSLCNSQQPKWIGCNILQGKINTHKSLNLAARLRLTLQSTSHPPTLHYANAVVKRP